MFGVKKIIILTVLAVFSAATLSAQDKPKDKFVLVIDPGHGGHDAGTVGTKRYKKYEKDIVLEVGLRFGNLIKKNMDDVQVVYTRDKDVFVTLENRPVIANKAKADLFISIHCNAVEKNPESAQGAETYVMGVDKTAANFEVAKRENSVIMLEDDYKQRYEGFDPKNPESMIAMTVVQNNHIGHSIEFAKYSQNYFSASGGRNDRGVRQGPFWVICFNSMPSVLVELGYLSNKAEEDFLHSDAGKDKMALSLYNAFKAYKVRFYDKTAAAAAALPDELTRVVPVVLSTDKKVDNGSVQQSGNTASAAAPAQGVVYKIQLCASSQRLNTVSDHVLKNFNQVEYYTESGIYKYTTGNYSTFAQASKALAGVKSEFVKDAFLVAFEDGQKTTVSRARARTD